MRYPRRGRVCDSKLAQRQMAEVDRQHVSVLAGTRYPAIIERVTPDSPEETARAFERAARALSGRVPDLWASMNPPATAEDLGSLAAAVEPWPLPPSLVTFLNLADGMALNPRQLWPSMECGRLLTAREMADEYRQNLTSMEPWQWSKRWLPISRFSWSLAAIELVNDRPAVILDASLPDPPRLAAPTLAGLLNAAVALADSGVLDNPPGPDDGEEHHVRALLRRRLLTEIYAGQGWDHAPVPPGRDIDPDEWPDYWFPPPDSHLYATRAE